jgi:hypothetical protein
MGGDCRDGGAAVGWRPCYGVSEGLLINAIDMIGWINWTFGVAFIK